MTRREEKLRGKIMEEKWIIEGQREKRGVGKRVANRRKREVER